MLGATDVDSAPYARAGNGFVDAADNEGNQRARTGRFLPGNRAWAARSTSAGPAPKFADGDALWKACVEYFEWVDANPLYAVHLVTYKGRTTQVRVPKVRAMTKGDLCRLRIQRSTWNFWKRDRPDLEPTVEKVESVIWCWQFSHAAAGLLDAGLVIRQLGIGRRAEQEHTR